MSPTLQYHLWMVGGRCVPPYSAIPPLDGRWKVCQQFCNTVSGWNGEGVSSALQYRSLDGRWKVVCAPTLQHRLWMEGVRWCVTYSAIPSLDGRRKVCPSTLQYLLWTEGGRWCGTYSATPSLDGSGRGVPYSAMPSLNGRGKVCQQLCNTVSR